MVFYATFNNISAVSWWSVVLVEESVVYRENHRPVASQWQTLSHFNLNVFYSEKYWKGLDSRTSLYISSPHLYHIMLYRVQLTWAGFELKMLVVVCTDCIGSYKSNYHMITTMTAPVLVCIILPEVLVYNLSFLGILVKNLNQLAKIHTMNYYLKVSLKNNT